jgi:iron complex transport system permease protein
MTARPGRPALTLALAGVLLGLLSLAAGSEGLSWAAWQADIAGEQASLLVGEIRAPRALGAWTVGALLGLAGAVAQGLFRNPLADPYLLGAASGASLGVVLVLVAGSAAGATLGLTGGGWASHLGIAGAAFGGALAGVGLTLLLAGGAAHSMRLLLAGVVVGVLLGAVSDLLITLAPQALRGRQAFLLGSTAHLGWAGLPLLAAGLALALPVAMRLARVLDALVALLALCTGLAVAQAGLIAFVGLVAPHLVRRLAPSGHAALLGHSALAGGALLLGADLLARALLAPRELPVGVVTAVLGGGYLLWLLHRGRQV